VFELCRYSLTATHFFVPGLIHCFQWRVLEVLDFRLHFLVALLQYHFHHMDQAIGWQDPGGFVFEHAGRFELPLVDTLDLCQRDDNKRLLWGSVEHRLIFVDEKTQLVQNEVSLEQVVVLVHEFVQRTLKHHLSILMGRLKVLIPHASTLFFLSISRICHSREHGHKIVGVRTSIILRTE